MAVDLWTPLHALVSFSVFCFLLFCFGLFLHRLLSPVSRSRWLCESGAFPKVAMLVRAVRVRVGVGG